MARIGLIFTTDYELFGNGTGCVEKCMIEPADRMINILESAGARLTLFVDVCEYWAFEQEFKKGKLKKDWAGMIREQLQNLVKRGHDVQLHFHPQWLNYSFDGKNWQLDYDLWRLGVLKYENQNVPELGLRELFARGKQCLEEMIKPVKPEYQCQVFRAGAWSMQPEKDALRAMQEYAFQIDSTVVPGLAFEDAHTYYDFSKAPEQEFSYRIQDDLNRPDVDGSLLEVPIFSTKVPLLLKAEFLRIKMKRRLAVKPTGCEGTALASSGKSKWKKLAQALTQKRSMFNFGDATSSEEMIYFARQAVKRAESRTGDLLPVVAISHPKTFANEGELQKFLNWAKERQEIKFIDYQTLIKE